MSRFSAVACPHCQGPLSKVESTTSARSTESRGHYRRTRRCLKCARMFNTYEISSSERAILVAIREWWQKQRTPDISAEGP